MSEVEGRGSTGEERGKEERVRGGGEGEGEVEGEGEESMLRKYYMYVKCTQTKST